MALICWRISSILTLLIKFPIWNLSEIGWLGVSQPGFHIKIIWGSFKQYWCQHPTQGQINQNFYGFGSGIRIVISITLDDSNVQQELKKAKRKKGFILYGVKNSTGTTGVRERGRGSIGWKDRPTCYLCISICLAAKENHKRYYYRILLYTYTGRVKPNPNNFLMWLKLY